MSDRIGLARAIAARTKPRFIEIPRERGGGKVPFTKEQLSEIRGGLVFVQVVRDSLGILHRGAGFEIKDKVLRKYLDALARLLDRDCRLCSGLFNAERHLSSKGWHSLSPCADLLIRKEAPTEGVSVLRRFDNRGCAGRARSGSLHVHEPRYNTQDYGANDHQYSLFGGHVLAKPLKKESPGSTHARG
jgi:hypothetical protein